jgi:hypothetical protein
LGFYLLLFDWLIGCWLIHLTRPPSPAEQDPEGWVKSEDREERRCDENEAEDEEAPLSRGLVGVGGQTLHMTENYARTATSIGK